MSSSRWRRRPTPRQWWAGVVALIVASWVVPLLWGSTWMVRHGRVTGMAFALAGVLGYEFVLRQRDRYVPPPPDPAAPPPGRHREAP